MRYWTKQWDDDRNCWIYILVYGIDSDGNFLDPYNIGIVEVEKDKLYRMFSISNEYSYARYYNTLKTIKAAVENEIGFNKGYNVKC